MKTKTYSDHRISFPMPEDWRVSHDKSGNMFYVDPLDSETWCFVEFGGLRQKATGQAPPSAWEVLRGIFEKEITSETASLIKLDETKALVKWVEETLHDEKDFLVYHFQLAERVASGDVQLAFFSLAAPKRLKDSPNILSKLELLGRQVTSAEFKIWK